MKRTKKIKTIVPSIPLDSNKQLKNIIHKLYKIKTISRKKQYTTNELEKLVLASSQGQQVITELNRLKISQEELEEEGFYLAAIILGPYLIN